MTVATVMREVFEMTKNKQNNKRKRKAIAIALVILMFLALEIGVICYFDQILFLRGTKIGGVDCSFMTVKTAKTRVEKEYKEQTCTLYFTTGEKYEIALSEMGVQVDEAKFAEIFNEQYANRKAARDYSFKEVISVDPEKLEKKLAQIPQLQKENMYAPQDAKIEWDGNNFFIVEEKYGNGINFQKAVQFALNRLQNGELEINFYSITSIYPEVYADDLKVRNWYLNSIVSSAEYFTLYNGEIVTLDSERIKTWVTKDAEGNYDIDQKNGIAEFVNELSAKVDEANSRIYFTAAHSDKVVSLPVSEELRPKLDMEKQKVEIENMLGGKGSYEVQLYYDRPFLTETEVFSNRIETDKTRQTVWGFENSEEFLESACVTGNVAQGYDTPVGIFYVTEKARNGKMTLYGLSEYKYLIAYDGNYCFHDSSWRYDYGGDIYKTAGSHGCTNMPEEGARILYEHSYLGMLVLIYET